MKGKVVTEEMFGMVKALVAGGARNVDIIKYTGLSDLTIGRIRHAKDMEAYRAVVAESKRKTREKKEKAEEVKAEEKKEYAKPVAEDTVIPVAQVSAYQVNRLIEKVSEQNEFLKLISAKMVYIVEQLT